MKTTLGIIGGMGAFAGVRLAQRILDISHDGKFMRDSDYPQFLLYNLPIEGMDERGIIDTDLVKTQLQDALAKMETWGCDKVIIACNSAHCFYDELQAGFGGKVLNMVQITCEQVKETCVGILCSETTRHLRLYEQILERKNIKFVTTTDVEQQALNEAVKNAISDGTIRGNLTDLETIIIKMTRRGAEEIIAGCTELPLILKNRIGIRVIDAGEETIKYALHG